MSTEVAGYIAIIDDDALVREGLRDCIESEGYAVEGFGSAEEFLISDSAQGAACLIVDVQLPGITGLELQRRMARTEEGVPVVFVTAHATDANRTQAIMQGAAGFFSKPVRREDLLNAIRAAIGR